MVWRALYIFPVFELSFTPKKQRLLLFQGNSSKRIGVSVNCVRLHLIDSIEALFSYVLEMCFLYYLYNTHDYIR